MRRAQEEENERARALAEEERQRQSESVTESVTENVTENMTESVNESVSESVTENTTVDEFTAAFQSQAESQSESQSFGDFDTEFPSEEEFTTGADEFTASFDAFNSSSDFASPPDFGSVPEFDSGSAVAFDATFDTAFESTSGDFSGEFATEFDSTFDFTPAEAEEEEERQQKKRGKRGGYGGYGSDDDSDSDSDGEDTASAEAEAEALLDMGEEGGMRLLEHVASGGSALPRALVASTHTEKLSKLLSASRTPSGRGPLHVAAAGGAEQWLEALLSPSLSLAADVDLAGRTALHDAASHGKASAVALLTGAGVPLDAQDHEGHTALHEAVAKGHDEAAAALVAAGAQASVAVLSTAALQRNSRILAVALGATNVDVKGRDSDGRTALHAAAYALSWESAELLLSSGAEVNAVDNSGKSAMHWALDQRRLNEGHDRAAATFIRLLSHYNCDLSLCDLKGRSALHYASFRGLLRCVRSLLDSLSVLPNAADLSDSTPLLAAVAVTPTEDPTAAEVVRALLEAGADPMGSGGVARSPLVQSCGRRLELCAAHCARAAADGTQTEESKRIVAAACVRAAGHGMRTVAESLFQIAEVESLSLIEEKSGRTLIHAAAAGGALSLLQEAETSQPELFREALAVKDSRGRSPLHLAAAKGHLDLLQWLLAKEGSAAAEASDLDGNTPLHYAAAAGQEWLLQPLLDAAPSAVDAVNSAGRTPGEEAQSRGIELALLP